MSIYLDYAATAPLRREVLAAMMPHMTAAGGNPSAMYASARQAREALEEARAAVASCIGAAPAEIVFTSGGTESNNWALQGMARFGGIVTTAAEHHAVLDVCAALERQGVPVAVADVRPDGTPEPGEIGRLLAGRPALLSVIYANNEVGVISPVAEIAQLAAGAGVPLHTDAVAAAGKIPIDVEADGISLLSASGHKFGGPRGTGFLYVREGLGLPPLLHGGRQERGRRAGTEDVAGAVGLAAALRLATGEMQVETGRLRALRDRLLERLQAIGVVRVNSSPDGLPSLLHVCLPGIRSEAALVFLDARGIECGAGAACAAGATRPSHVLRAMGVPETEAACALRISMGSATAESDLDQLVEALAALLQRHAGRMGT